MMKYCLLICLLWSMYSHADIHIEKKWRMPTSQVNGHIARLDIPPTPNQVALPIFGQHIIAWGTGIEGAKSRLEQLTPHDVLAMQQQGVTFEMIQQWQAFYENEQRRNPANITAYYRTELMKKIISLWSNIATHQEK